MTAASGCTTHTEILRLIGCHPGKLKNVGWCLELQWQPKSDPVFLLESASRTMDDLSRFCCLNSRCPDFGRRGAGNRTVTGRLGKEGQYRLLYCRSCRARSSERKGTPLYRAHLPEDQVASILAHVAEGCGVLQTARLVKVDPDTVSRYIRAAGAQAEAAHDELVARSPLTRELRMDEAWSFVAKTEKNCDE